MFTPTTHLAKFGDLFLDFDLILIISTTDDVIVDLNVHPRNTDFKFRKQNMVIVGKIWEIGRGWRF